MTKILVIEDEDFIRENIVELLELENFNVIGAENGQAGIEIARKTLPDLILCDVMMPELDGYSVLEALRAEPTTATIPFIFLTALVDKMELRQGMELGADDYLTKPCLPADLLKAIASRLKKQAAINRSTQEKLEELRSSIVHSLPHELRTPLNGILGFSQLLMHQAGRLSDSEVREMASGIYRSGQRLNQLIQNFLLYADLEIIATNPEQIAALRAQETKYSEILIMGASLLQARAANREADLQIEIQDSPVQISETRLQKIIEELLDNAFKFSSAGTPVCLTSQPADRYLCVTITDRGRGMTPEQIAQLGAYMQFERKLYEQQGTGLGLAIARRLVELHGGQLTVDSIPSEQTTVQILLPISA